MDPLGFLRPTMRRRGRQPAKPLCSGYAALAQGPKWYTVRATLFCSGFRVMVKDPSFSGFLRKDLAMIQAAQVHVSSALPFQQSERSLGLNFRAVLLKPT